MLTTMPHQVHFQLGHRIGRIFLCLLSAIAGCGPRTHLPLGLILSTNDLPANFQAGGTSIQEIAGGTANFGDYFDSGDTEKVYISIKHKLGIYPSASEATAAYTSWAPSYFPSAYWEDDGTLQFSPRDPSDPFRFGCMPVTINAVPILSCRYLQQHSRFISLILMNTDGEAITIAQLEHAIDRLDERLFNYRPPGD
ncbi:MAG TPA: hypothetical protein VJK02_10780 [Anaerolineales bacterium]|nr:hypothetical protein [Anaerolineales bacterium]